jgi:hypothetical protein
MCISEAGTILRWFSGAYLMRSSGHILLSLLPIFGWLNRSVISWLLCAVQFLWFFAYVLMTSIKYGIKLFRRFLLFVQFRIRSHSLSSWLADCVLSWNWSSITVEREHVWFIRTAGLIVDLTDIVKYITPCSPKFYLHLRGRISRKHVAQIVRRYIYIYIYFFIK